VHALAKTFSGESTFSHINACMQEGEISGEGKGKARSIFRSLFACIGINDTQ
jgi:hypothetical protein